MFWYNKVGIRPVEYEDLEFLIELRSYPEVWMNLGKIEMLTRYKQDKWYKSLYDKGDGTKKYYVLMKEDKDPIGMVRTDEIDYINSNMRVGGDILPNYHDNGYGADMMDLIIHYGFDYMNMHRLWLMVLENNDRALHLYKKHGFIEEGVQRKAIYRNGEYLDYIMMSILKEDLQ